MITIARLRMQHWKCFAGETVLELVPKTYAIFARHATDESRSNWLGKTSICQAIDYALTGRIPADCVRKSDWITNGEKAGEVELVLSNGVRILRGMGRTKPEKVWYFPAPGDPAMQDEADKAIARELGLSVDDFWTSYFRQGEMAKLVRCDPSERLGYVASWMRLEPIQACEQDVSAVLSELARRRSEESSKAGEANRTISEQLARVAAHLGTECLDVETLHLLISGALSDAQRYQAELEIVEQHAQQARERSVLEASAKRYEQVVDEGKRLVEFVGKQSSTALSDAVKVAESAFREIGDRKAVVQQDLERKRALVRGQFDGRCPVVGEACPARAFVQENASRNLQNHLAVAEQEKQLREQYDAAATADRDAHTVLRAYDDNQQKLKNLREEARRLKPAYEKWKELAPPGVEPVLLTRQTYEALNTKYLQLKAALAVIEDAGKRRDDALIAAERYDKSARTAAAALAIFGKNGAQRRIAEEVLGGIEADANDDLAAAGIGLSVKFVWSREGQKLADSCEQCGESFPATRTVKECGRCGSPRGPNLINKLEFQISNRSGAADDLAAAFTQFAASAWLRADRESRWAMAMLDEPLGQLDAANRRAFASHLPGLLSRAGFAQAFLVAHHSNVLDAMPGRILIESDGLRSTAKVAIG